MAQDKKTKASDKFADSKATMVGRSIKAGVKSAIKTAGAGGMVDKARKALSSKTAKTKKAIDEV